MPKQHLLVKTKRSGHLCFVCCGHFHEEIKKIDNVAGHVTLHQRIQFTLRSACTFPVIKWFQNPPKARTGVSFILSVYLARTQILSFKA